MTINQICAELRLKTDLSEYESDVISEATINYKNDNEVSPEVLKELKKIAARYNLTL